MIGAINPEANFIPFSILSRALLTAKRVVFVEVLWNRRSNECTCENTYSDNILIPSLRYNAIRLFLLSFKIEENALANPNPAIP